MIGWVVLGAWVLCGLLAFRPVFAHLLDLDDGDVEGAWSLLLILFFLSAAISFGGGPLACVWAFGRGRGDPDAVARSMCAIAGESRIEKTRRLEREAREREAHIRRLELELGIGDHDG